MPVLVLSGREDLRTPTEDARRPAAEYPHAQVLTIPGVGHSVLTSELTSCGLDGMVAFLAGQPLEQCTDRKDGKLLARIPVAAPFMPASVSELRPMKVGGLPGRTLTAVNLTVLGVINDALVTPSKRVPGLRSGFVTKSGRTLRLTGVEWFRGVSVSGTLTGPASGTFTVSGPNAAPGTLTVPRGKVSGTLGSRSIG